LIELLRGVEPTEEVRQPTGTATKEDNSGRFHLLPLKHSHDCFRWVASHHSTDLHTQLKVRWGYPGAIGDIPQSALGAEPDGRTQRVVSCSTTSWRVALAAISIGSVHIGVGTESISRRSTR
jgi:hypothetical protein